MSPQHTHEETVIKNKQFDFKSLAPKTDVDLTAYEEAFQFALSNDEIKNVAVTGSYGAGKSSVMETFKATEAGQAHTYLHISLAHFEKTNSSDDESKTEEQLEHQLEGKIINQLIHKIPIEKIPDTRVALRKTPDEESVLKWTLGILAGIIASLYLVFYQSMLEVVTKDYFISKICRVLTKPEWLFLAVVIEGVLLFCLIKYLVSAQMKNRFFKKICIKDSEIELFEEEGDKEKNKTFSYFDRYLDEIKYLLLNADVDVFVFEDIDRYNINLIFEKLREINSIVNVSSKKTIRFFYLIRDDLFVQKDRTKFFDFIIPVLPIVSGHNAFHVYLEYMGLDGKLKREFLKQISLFIDDMRLLNNIYNEYQIYQHKMDKISVDKSAEKIFSMVTYKNLFPEDFIRLQRREGYIVDLFEEKKKQAEERLNKIEEELTLIQSDLKVTIDENKIKELQSQEDSLIDERIRLKGFNFQEYVAKYKFKGLEQGILSRGDKVKKEYNKKMNTSLYAGLVRNLLSGGYIDENYGGLIAMFHDSDISHNDMKFVRAVLDDQCLDYTYKLDDVSIVNDYLEDRNIESQSIINLDMFYYYMNDINQDYKNDEERRVKRREIMANTICSYQKYDFVKLLLEDENIAYSLWVDRLCDIWEDIYKEAKKNTFEWEKVDIIFATALMGDELLELTCLQEGIEEYILYTVCKDASVFEKVLAHDKKEGADRQTAVFKFSENLDFLGWKLPQFQFDLVNSKAFADEIYMSNAYVLNVYMIKQILNLWYGINIKGKVVRLYDKIVSVNEQNIENDNIPLYQYIEENMDTFIDMLINSQIEVADSSKNVTHMILLADEEHKKKLVSYMKTSIESVEAINDLSIINSLIKREKLAYKAKNILEYYDLYTDTKEEYEEEEIEFTFDDMLVEYINQMPIKKIHLTKAEDNEYYEKNKKRMSDLFVDICKRETIEDEKYRVAVNMLGFSWADAAPLDIPESKMDILIEEDIIKMSKDMLSSMRKRYPSNIQKFILTNIDVYMNEIVEANNFNFEECIMLLETDIKDGYKQELLSYTTKSVSVRNDKYSEKLILYILENHYDRTDFEYIIRQNYQNEELQEHINRLAEGRIAEIIREDYALSKSLCLYLLKPETDCISQSQKEKIFVDNIKQFSMDEVNRVMQQLKMTEFLPLFANRNPLIKVNPLNTKILLALQKQGFVGNFDVDERIGDCYRVYSKKKWNK